MKEHLDIVIGAGLVAYTAYPFRIKLGKGFPMRHRKKLFVATFVLVTVYAAWCFWPHSNPQAVRALEALRAMVDIGSVADVPRAGERQARANVMIEVQCELATINMTDATAGLFAEAGKTGDKALLGRLKSSREFLELARRSNTIQFDGPSVIASLFDQQTAGFVSGEAVAVGLALPGPTATPVVLTSNLGSSVSVTATMSAADMVALDLDCKMSRAGRLRTVATPQGPKEVLDEHSLSVKVRSQVKIGETLVIGGVSQKRPDRMRFELPLLSTLPRVGAWFSFPREREIEEELVILVTPRLVAAIAEKSSR